MAGVSKTIDFLTEKLNEGYRIGKYGKYYWIEKGSESFSANGNAIKSLIKKGKVDLVKTLPDGTELYHLAEPSY